MNKVAVVMRKAPYGTVYTAEGFRTLMGIAVFEMEISVVFADDGVYALVAGQAPGKLDMKPLGDGFPMLAEFGVSSFYVHDESLQERGLTAPGASSSTMVEKALSDHAIYALDADLEARGIDSVIAGIQIISYEGFVELVERHDVAPWL
jgi:tRNA 2-thiouridine synthesizing protein C